MRIMWVCDVPGWAFDNESRQVMHGMTQHTHSLVYSGTDSAEQITYEAEAADAIVIHSVQGLKLIPQGQRGKVLQRLTGIRSMTGWRR